MIKNELGPIKDLGNITNKEFHYGLIPNEGLTRKTVYDNLILVGDSAGMANPLVLEGIRYAIKYGRLAGSVSAESLHSGDTSEKSLEKIGMNDAENAPSDVILLKIFGIRNAIKNASAT